MILYLTKDLMLASNVRSVAGSANIDLTIVPTAEKLTEQINSCDDLDKVLIDLQTPGLTRASFPQIVAACHPHSVPVIGYAQHVHVDLIEAAQSAGFAAVYTRGQMNGNVAAILSQ
jgi:membrane-bound ClpP family serine protease